MNFESPLPKEATAEMNKVFEGVRPVISESQLKELCENNENLNKLFHSMMDYALRYAHDVWSMQKFVNDGGFSTENGAAQFAEMDTARTRLHNALIDSIAILSRSLGQEGKNNEWVRELTNGTTLERAKCGTFALLLVYHRYLDTV